MGFVGFSLSTFLMKHKLFLFYYKADLCPAEVGGIEQGMGAFLSVQNLGSGLGLKEPCLEGMGRPGEHLYLCVQGGWKGRPASSSPCPPR